MPNIFKNLSRKDTGTEPGKTCYAVNKTSTDSPRPGRQYPPYYKYLHNRSCPETYGVFDTEQEAENFRRDCYFRTFCKYGFHRSGARLIQAYNHRQPLCIKNDAWNTHRPGTVTATLNEDGDAVFQGPGLYEKIRFDVAAI